MTDDRHSTDNDGDGDGGRANGNGNGGGGNDGGEGLTDFVTDPAARAELARRMEELADLINEADEALGDILDSVQRVVAAESRHRDTP
ncbi:hypothetical protein FE633_19845 [Streptomyces montanus]|uniref:Uncharacterized protein n=1 Tax=Streptomyces montanus TaxID=2580423 RepID=A0A5R9FL14_9ACTN|nr:hypothetical protein [Streptomyces montanus]TLS44557.1 hypothetical protein FE633_19845 [Streptomyces montanus]